MLRIGLLLNSTDLQAWQLETVRQLNSSGLADISFLVINPSYKVSGNSSSLLYRLYRKLDRLLFKSEWDAFESHSLYSILPKELPTLQIQPIQKKHRDYFSDSDLSQIAHFAPDLLIRFGFRVLSGPILDLPKLGVWSFHHGDPKVYRGGPPAFWEVFRQIPATGCVLMQITENLDQGKVLYQTHTQTDPLSVQRNANKIFWMSASFPVRVIREIHRVGLEAWKRKIDEMEIPSKSPLWKNPEPLELVNGLTKLIFRNLLRKWREMRFPAHWEIGILSGLEFENQVIPRKDVSFFPEKKNSEGFFADPFPIFHGGKWLIFAELFDKKKAKGSIALLDELGNAQVVLEEPWHLSYPFVWEEGGNNYLLPESAEAGQLFLYRAVDFPFSWEKAQVIFPKEAYDPTLWKTEEGYWLFVNQKSHPACSPFDELYLYFSSTLTSPDWISHPENPIVSNVGSSRPAGRLFVKNGILYRPAQDSEKRYGHRMRIMEVKELSRVRYREQEAFTIEADETGGFLGVHSLNQMGDRWVVDFYSRK